MWLSSSSGQDAAQRLQKAAIALERDFPMASVSNVRVRPVPASLSGGGYDGDAIWFLSAVNPHDGKAYVKADGTPFWQCHIIYYSVVPDQVEALATRPIRAGITNDYEDRCPHKVLVRKVVDVGTPTDASDEDSAEVLMDDPSRFLTRPTKYDVSAMTAQAETLKVDIVTNDILYFRAETQTAPSGVQFDLRALGIEEANSVATAQSISLLDSPFTKQSLLFVKARN